MHGIDQGKLKRRRQFIAAFLAATTVYLSVFSDTSPYPIHQRFLREEDPALIGTIHLGKCGGMTLENTLNAPNQSGTSLLVQNRGKRYHIDAPKIDLYDNWMVLIRDPIERVKTSWIFEHVDNYPFKKDPRPHAFKYKLFECYDTLDELLTKGLIAEPPYPNDDDICPLMAKQLFQKPSCGEGYGMYHFQYNFTHYFGELMDVADTKKIYVVRSEHMLDDLNHIEVILGAKTNHTFTRVRPHNHYRVESQKDLPKHDRSLSKEGLEILCKELCYEIQIYKDLFRASENLGKDDWDEMMADLSAKCPEEARASECPPPPHLLSLKEKLRLESMFYRKWGYPPKFDGLKAAKKQKP